jgi:hypothetical protein
MALWGIKSPEVKSHGFGTVAPLEILSEFDGPLTFTFADATGNLFLAHLCAVGDGVSRYLVAETDNLTIADLKNGMTSIRSAILKPVIWLIDVNANGNAASVWQPTENELPEDTVPANDVLLTPELEAIQSADQNLSRFARSRNAGQIAFSGGPVEGHEIEASFYGKFFQQVSDLLGEVCRLMELEVPVLRLGMTHESSYAVDLTLTRAAGEQVDIFDILAKKAPNAGRTRIAFDNLMSLISEERLPDDALFLVKRSQSLRHRYGNVLELMHASGATVSVRTRTRPAPRVVTGQEAGTRLRLVRELYMFLTVRGRLFAGSIERRGRNDRSFQIAVDRGEKKEDFDGTISDRANEKMLDMKFGDEVVAKLQIEDGPKGQTYTLADIDHRTDGSPHGVE